MQTTQNIVTAALSQIAPQAVQDAAEATRQLQEFVATHQELVTKWDELCEEFRQAQADSKQHQKTWRQVTGKKPRWIRRDPEAMAKLEILRQTTKQALDDSLDRLTIATEAIEDHQSMHESLINELTQLRKEQTRAQETLTGEEEFAARIIEATTSTSKNPSSCVL